MADIEVVIKIDEDIYKRFTHNEVRPRCEITEEERFQMDADAVRLTRAFCNGTPLPKGHGRLIDAGGYENSIRKHYFDNSTVIRCTEIALNNAPTIIEAEQTKWIPVSEKLPEDKELLLFSTKTDRVFEGRYFDDNTEHQWYSFRDETFARNNVVTAWMPLPEPYKAESEGNG